MIILPDPVEFKIMIIIWSLPCSKFNDSYMQVASLIIKFNQHAIFMMID